MTEQEWLVCEDPQRMLTWLGAPYSGGVSGIGGGKPYAFTITDRKLRLFACAMWRGHPDILAKYGASDLPAITERIADGKASGEEVSAARELIGLDVDGGGLPYVNYVAQAARHLAGVLLPGPKCVPEKRRQAALLRDIVGNPFQPPRDPRVVYAKVPLILSLAEAAYEERAGRKCEACINESWRRQSINCKACGNTGHINDGSLDPVRLAILADALEEGGCDDGVLLRHLRGEEWCLELWPKHGNPAYHGTTSRYGPLTHSPGCKCRGTGWIRNRGPCVRGCWALDLILGNS